MIGAPFFSLLMSDPCLGRHQQKNGERPFFVKVEYINNFVLEEMKKSGNRDDFTSCLEGGKVRGKKC